MSINDGIRLYNATRTSDVALPLLTVEALLALTLNQLERYLSLYEHVGMAAIEADYYRYWLHRCVGVGVCGCVHDGMMAW